MSTVLGRKARVASGAVAVSAALVTSAVLVLQASNAAFSATTKPDNPSTWGTAVAPTLTNDAPTATAMFTATGLGPGDSGQKCINVTATIGTPTADLRFYSVRSDSNTLASQLNVTVERGSGGGFGSCTGFTPATTLHNTTLDQLPGNYTAAAGKGLVISNPGGSAVYRISYSLPSNLSTSYAGQSTGTAFTWEIQ